MAPQFLELLGQIEAPGAEAGFEDNPPVEYSALYWLLKRFFDQEVRRHPSPDPRAHIEEADRIARVRKGFAHGRNGDYERRGTDKVVVHAAIEILSRPRMIVLRPDIERVFRHQRHLRTDHQG